MKKVVAYTRVSTDAQVDKFGLDAQREMIQDYCDKHDMQIMMWYCDRGVSGVKEERPEFDRLLYGDVENPPVEAVIVAKNDRVSRDIKLYYYFKMLLKKRNIELISVSEDFGELGPMASFLEAFTLCVAEMERENITRRTSAGRKQKVNNGGYAGGRPPYGYYVVDGELKVNEIEAMVVRLVFDLRNKGMILREIADVLNQKGYKTQMGNEFNFGAVANILKNELVYKGQMRYGRVYKGKQDKILY